MFFRDICRIVGIFTLFFTAVLLIPFLLAVYYQYIADPGDHPQEHVANAFLDAIAISLICGASLLFIGRKASGHLFRREGLAAVVLIWFLTPALAALPFYLSGTLENPWQAYFESSAGFTTTGSTVMQAKKFDPETGKEVPYVVKWTGVRDTTYTFYGTIDPIRDPVTGAILYEGLEAVSKVLLFWRSFIQYLGGLGIIVLFVAVLPVLGVGGKLLFWTEAPGPMKDALTPRIKETAMQLWKIYLGLTVLQVFVLMLTNAKMEWFDAITLALSTMSTGGTSIHNEGIAYYQNVATEWVIIVFMIFGSINFSLYYYILKGKLYRLYDRELLLYLALMIIACVFVVWKLQGTEEVLMTKSATPTLFTWDDSIRYGVFQMVSTLTSTGFVTANYDAWPYIIQVIMLIAMFVGGMSGSTSGGMKVIRVYMLFKIAQNKVESFFRPSTVQNFQVGERRVDPDTATLVLCFFLTLISMSVLGVFMYILNGLDPETAIGLVACNINNSGFSFRMAGPTSSCAFLTDFGLAWSSLLMLFGRLEFFAVLAVLVPAFWKQHS